MQELNEKIARSVLSASYDYKLWPLEDTFETLFKQDFSVLASGVLTPYACDILSFDEDGSEMEYNKEDISISNFETR